VSDQDAERDTPSRLAVAVQAVPEPPRQKFA
jgi:hypothetical protein